VSTTDQLLEHHAAIGAGLRPPCLLRPPAQQAAALAYRMPPSASTGSWPEGGRRRRPQGDWRDCEQGQIRLFLSRMTDAARTCLEVAMGGEELLDAKAGDRPRTIEAPKTDWTWWSAPRRRS
jgi:hypothetical protein